MYLAFRGVLAAVTVALALGACAALPSGGPLTGEIDRRSSEAPETTGYAVVDVDENIAHLMAQEGGPSLYGRFGNRRPPPLQRIGVGDVLSISVFEAAPGGLFSPPAGSFVSSGSRNQVIPNQTVDQDGTIEIPYGGRIRAAGRTPAEIARDAEQQLAARAIEPKVVVTVIENGSSLATVLGEVTAGGRIKLNIRGDRLLDVIAQVGGSRAPEYETLVRLARRGRTETVPLRTIVNRPSENIFIQPDDTIYLLRSPQVFSAFGATPRPGEYPIDKPVVTLSDALGKVGGLIDLRADSAGVFLFRYESQSLAERVAPGWRGDPRAQGVPMVYRIRFSDPRAFLLAQSIPVRNGDVLYVANSTTAEFYKFVSLLQGLVSVGITPLRAASAL